MGITTYRQLSTAQKELANHKIALRIQAPEKVVKIVLLKIDPPIKIIEQHVIMAHELLKAIEENVKSEKL